METSTQPACCDRGNEWAHLGSKRVRGFGAQPVSAFVFCSEQGFLGFYMASLPLSANVQSLTVLTTTMPFVGRG